MKKASTVKRLLSLVLCLCMVLSLLPAIPLQVDAASGSDGNGVNGDLTNGVLNISDSDAYEQLQLNDQGIYEISNADDLFSFAQLVNSGETNVQGVVTADINLAGKVWTPMGSESAPFTGTFDGAGHSLKNFALDITTGGDWGFIGFASNATVKDFSISGEAVSNLTAEPTNEFDYGVIAQATGNVVVQNVHSAVNLTVKDSYYRNTIGGILGRNNSTGAGFAIEGCSFSGTLNLGTAQVDCTGGILAYAMAGHTVKLNNCLFRGSIISQFDGAMQIGGQMGYYRGSNLTVTNCLSIGTITGTDATLHGMIVGVLRQHDSANTKLVKNYYSEGTQPFGNSSAVDDITDGRGGQTVSGSATAVTKNQVTSGEVAYLLGNAWGQNIDNGETNQGYPVPGGQVVLYGYISCAPGSSEVYTNDANASEEKPGHTPAEDDGSCITEVKCILCGEVSTEANADHNWQFVCGKPKFCADCQTTEGEILGHNYVNGFCIDCDAYEPAVDSDGDGYYEIGNAGQLYWFAQQSDAQNHLNVKLTANIDVNPGYVFNANGTVTKDGEVVSSGWRKWVPIGQNLDSIYTYTKTFDGNGHYISGLYNVDQSNYTGLFAKAGATTYVRATIKNLGIINTYFDGGNRTSSIVGIGYYMDLINCYSNATLKGATYSSGLVTPSNKNDKFWCRVQNSYYFGKADAKYDFCAIASNVYNPTVVNSAVTNCYYLEGCSKYIKDVTPTAITADQLTSGELTWLLNGSRSEGVWKQAIGTDAYPVQDGPAVYQVLQCDNETLIYSNDPNSIHMTLDETASYCSTCGWTDPAKAVSQVTIGDQITYYHTFDRAISAVSACTAEDNAVLKLLKDVDLGTRTLRISDGVYTLDLNGKTLKNDYSRAGVLTGYAEITIIDTAEGGTIYNANSGGYGLHIWKKLTIAGGTISSAGRGVYCDGGSVYIIGGTVTGDEAVHMGYASATISGGIISGTTCDIYALKAPELTVGENGVGATFPGGITAEWTDLDDIIGEGCAYWRNGKQFAIADGVTEISGGDVVIMPECDHEGRWLDATCFAPKTCSGCDKTEGEPLNHTGGTATCAKQAVCELCGGGYGSFAADNHADNTNTKHTDNSDGTHSLICSECTKPVSTENHLGGKATCTDQAACSACGAPYGELDGDNHAAPGEYINGFQVCCGAYEPAPLNEQDVYEISNAGQLYWFAALVNGGQQHVNAIVTQDITVNENVLVDNALNGDGSNFRTWTPIGPDYNTGYAGIFDGQGHTISGLYCISSDDLGLFGILGAYIDREYIPGTVQNLRLEDSYFKDNGSGGDTGAISGEICYTSIVFNCSADAVVIGTYAAGGLVGWSEGKVEYCSFSGSVTGDSYVGGIVGSNGMSSNAETNNCFNSGSVHDTSYYGSAGGIVGKSDAIVRYCLNTGSVTSQYAYGIAGTSSNYRFANNYYLAGTAAGGTCVNSTTGRDPIDLQNIAEAATAERLASGEVAFLLQADQTEQVWGQNIDNGGQAQPLPVFSEARVYRGYNGCQEFYSNTVPTVTKITHSFDTNGLCTVCDHGYEPPEKVDDVYQLKNAGNLYWFAAVVNGGYEGVAWERSAKAVLTADIVVNENVLQDGVLNGDGSNFRSWIPIGTREYHFQGSFNGQGHTISGLYINGSSDVVGLFGAVDNYSSQHSGICNLGVIDSYIRGASYVGGIAGALLNYSVLEYCWTDMAVVGSSYVGGIVGHSGSTTYMYGTAPTVVRYCYALGSVEGSDYVGGLVGYNNSTSGYTGNLVYATLENSYSTASVNGSYGMPVGENYGIVNNIYYLAESDSSDGGKTAEQFASGEVAWLLNGSTDIPAEGKTLVWYQNLDNGQTPDSSPVLSSSHGSVHYGIGSCAEDAEETYTNYAQRPDHDYQHQAEWSFYGDSAYVSVEINCAICGDSAYDSGYAEQTGSYTGTSCQDPSTVTYSYTYSFNDQEYTVTETFETGTDPHTVFNAEGFCTDCGGYQKPTVDPGEDPEWDYDDVYLIYNAGQLFWFASEVNDPYGGHNGITGKLMADIDLNPGYTFHADGTYEGGDSPRAWEPIGWNSCYSGNFDGNGFVVSGAYTVSDRNYVGLFGNTDYNYEIKNLGVTNSYFQGVGYVGGISGYAYTYIRNCYVTDTVYVVGKYDTAALVGYIGCEICNSYAMTDTLVAGGWGSVYNSYAYTEGEGITAVTAEDFASGKVAYLLQENIYGEDIYDEETGEITGTNQVWGQTIGEDVRPVAFGQKVYQVLDCDGVSTVYSNTNENRAHSWTDATCFAPMTCSVCKATSGEPLVHVFDSTTGLCKHGCGHLMAVAMTTVADVTIYHETLDAAIQAVKDCTADSAAKVTLLQSVAMGDGYLSVASGVFVLDLNGFELSTTNTSYGALHLAGSDAIHVTVMDSGSTGKLYGAYYGIYVYDGSLTMLGGSIIGEIYGINIWGKSVHILGGSIEGGSYDIYAVIEETVLEVGPNGIGATFPGGITVCSATLNELLAEGAAYWAGDTMVTPLAEDEEINGRGDIVIKAACTHSTGTKSYVDHGQYHMIHWSCCGTDTVEDHSIDQTTGHCTICQAKASVLVTVNGSQTYYAYLAEAVEAVKNCTAQDHAQIKLCKDISLGDSGQHITAGVFTLDLNGFTLSNTAQHSTLLYLDGVHILDVTIVDSGSTGKLISNDYAIQTYDAKLTIHGGTFISDNDTVVYACSGTQLCITGGTIKGYYGLSVYASDATISGGEFVGQSYAAHVYGGTMLVVTGGTFTCPADVLTIDGNGTTAEIAGGSFTGGVGVETTYNAIVKITGGSFDCDTDLDNWSGSVKFSVGENGIGATFVDGMNVDETTLNELLVTGVRYWAGETLLTVNDGVTEITDRGDITVKAICDHAENENLEDGICDTEFVCSVCGFAITEAKEHICVYQINADGTHTKTCTVCGTVITEEHSFNKLACVCGEASEEAVAIVTMNGAVIGGYTSLKEAISAVRNAKEKNDAVVKLIKSLDLGSSYQSINGGVFTLDLNGMTLTSSGSNETLIVFSPTWLTIIDTAGNGAIRNTGTWERSVKIHGGTVNIESGTLMTPNVYGGTLNVYGNACLIGEDYALEISGGTVNISGGTITSNSWYSYYATIVARRGQLNITGGSISGGVNDIRVDTCEVVLGIGDNGVGATFPGGITVTNATLNAILGDGAAYWQGNTQIAPADDATTITGGDVVIKVPCSHENFTVSYRDNGENHNVIWSCCGLSVTEGHSYEAGETKAPTCTEAGFTDYACTLCGNSYQADEIPASGHSWNDDGICMVCGYDPAYVIVINMTDSYGDGWNDNAIAVYEDGVLVDTVTITEGKEASWSGEYDPDKLYQFYWVRGKYPTECSFEIQLGVEEPFIASKGDCSAYTDGQLLLCTHKYGEGVVTAPTCTQDGYTTYTCSCGHNYTTDPVPAGHSWIDATCTEPKTCSVCGTPEGNALGHSAPVYTNNGDTHDVDYPCCDALDATGVEHSYVDGFCACGAEEVILEGIVELEGDLYYYENGVAIENKGLVQVIDENGHIHYYYFGCGVDGCSSGEACMGSFKAQKNNRHYVSITNGYLMEGGYTFGDDCTIEHIEDTSVNGIYEIDGVKYCLMDGVKVAKGLFEQDGKFYYARSSGALVVGQDYWVSKTNGLSYKGEPIKNGMYTFDENGAIQFKVDKNGFVFEDGVWNYYVEGEKNYAGLIWCDGPEGNDPGYYYVNSKGMLVTDCAYWISKNNGHMKNTTYYFDANGTMYTPAPKNGFYFENDAWYYYVDGSKNYAGLIWCDGPDGNDPGYYYVNSQCKLITGCDYWISKNNGLMGNQTYTFDANGTMLQVSDGDSGLLQGIVEENGELYYYEDGIKTYAGLILIDGDYYYVNSKCKVIRNCTYWISKNNGYMKNGNYKFDAEGKMIQA